MAEIQAVYYRERAGREPVSDVIEALPAKGGDDRLVRGWARRRQRPGRPWLVAAEVVTGLVSCR